MSEAPVDLVLAQKPPQIGTLVMQYHHGVSSSTVPEQLGAHKWEHSAFGKNTQALLIRGTEGAPEAGACCCSAVCRSTSAAKFDMLEQLELVELQCMVHTWHTGA